MATKTKPVKPAKATKAPVEKKGVQLLLKVTGETAELFLLHGEDLLLHTDLQLSQANAIVETGEVNAVAAKEVEAVTSNEDVLANKKEAKYFA